MSKPPVPQSTPISVIFKLFQGLNEQQPTLIGLEKIDIETQMKLLNPLKSKSHRRHILRQFYTTKDLRKHASAKKRIESILCQYYKHWLKIKQKHIKMVKNWNAHDFLVSIIVYFIQHGNDNISRRPESVETKDKRLKISWTFLDYLLRYFNINMKDFDGQKFVDEYSPNNNENNYGKARIKPSFSLRMVRRVCRQYGQKLAPYTEVKKQLYNWAKQITQRHEQEVKFEESMILFRTRKIDINTPNLSVPRRCKGLISIEKTFTMHIIPQQIKEKIHNIYDYMDESMKFQHNKIVYNDGGMAIINFNFHDKYTNEPLYCIMDKQKSEKRPWRMWSQLFTAEMIEEKYNISADKLPPEFGEIIQCKPMQKTMVKTIIDNFKNENSWHELPIYNKVNNRQRRVLHLTKEEFIKKVTNTAEILGILPLVSFDKNSSCIENIMIINLIEDVDIGISFQVKPTNNETKVTGIHLDKDEILLHHQMASPYHDCHCLDNFKSNIDDLKIGNTYNQRNQIEALRKEKNQLRGINNRKTKLKQENKKLQDESKTVIDKYIADTLKNLHDLLSQDMNTALSVIKSIFNENTIKYLLANCIKSKLQLIPTSHDLRKYDPQKPLQLPSLKTKVFPSISTMSISNNIKIPSAYVATFGSFYGRPAPL